MGPITTSVVTSIAVNYFTGFTEPLVRKFFATTFQYKPELEARLLEAKTSRDIEAVFQEAIDVIDLKANQGEIEIFGGLVQAIKGVRFDHVNGLVHINGTTISSEIIVTGGSVNSTGTTLIQEGSLLKTQGTSISVGNGCSIRITGNAQIRQT
ncbi:hypothetical protein HFP66_15840 [Bacillus sp. A17A.1]